MSKIYTNIHQRGNNFLVRGIENGERFEYKNQFSPTLYSSTSNAKSEFTNIFGDNVKPINFDNISEARQFIKSYSNDSELKVYGMDNFEYQFIHDEFPDDLTKISKKDIVVYSIDIEVFSGVGGPFPAPYKTVIEDDENGIETQVIKPLALYPIPMISIKTWDNKTHLFTACPYEHDKTHPDIGHLDMSINKYRTEEEMLLGFLSWWSKNPPDIITGWNSTLFDMPYIINRIKRLATHSEYESLHSVSNGVYPKAPKNPFFKKMGLEKMLSPWKIVTEKSGTDNFKNPMKYYQIAGISQLDYYEIYTKFTFVTQTSYKLDHICSVELDTTKIEYSENHINDFFVNDIQKYTEYNIHDANLVHLLDIKKKFMNIVYTLTYISKCNFEDVFGTIRPWDSLIYGMLLNRNMVVPLKEAKDKIRYPGAFVKMPKSGKYGMMASFDFNSLYPKVIEEWNIGPDTIIPPEQLPDEIKQLITYNCEVEWLEKSEELCKIHGLEDLVNKKENLDILKKYDICMAANGSFFRTDIQSIFAEKVSEIYAARKAAKSRMNQLKSKMESEKDQLSQREMTEIDDEIDILFGLQMAYKIFMNSLYGATGTPYFRWYHNDIASAITISAQLANRFAMKKFNQLFNKILNTENADYVIYGDTDSTHKDTEISYRMNNDETVITETIEEFYDKMGDSFLKNDIENQNFSKIVKNVETLSMNVETKKFEYQPINYVKKHLVNKEMFKLTVEDKEVIITCDHSLMVDRDGHIIEVKPSDVLLTDKFIKVI